MWTTWQASTVAGALLGNSVPDSVPLDFAVPLVFLVLLIPTLSHLHAVVAAAVGGVVTVIALELGVGPLAVMIGALAGVAAGAAVRHRRSGRTGVAPMSTTWIAILLAGAGTFAMRASFLAAAHRLAAVPPRVQRLLRQIPPAALASLVVPALVRPDGQLSTSPSRAWPLACWPRWSPGGPAMWP